jgi:iron complex outermembrane receptor protein
VLSGTVLTLNVDNLLDKDPPFYNGCVGGAGVCGFTNGSTLGRLVTFGLRTHF